MLGWTDEDLDSKEIKDDLENKRAYKLVDTCSAEFLSKTPYLYSTFGTSDDDSASKNKKVVVIGSGPNRICLLYTSPSPRDRQKSRMPSSA